MNETEKKIIRYIRNLRPIILQDGQLDIVETAWLVKAIHQDEDSLGEDFKAFVARLREVRADGVVTSEESESLVRMMDALLAQDNRSSDGGAVRLWRAGCDCHVARRARGPSA